MSGLKYTDCIDFQDAFLPYPAIPPASWQAAPDRKTALQVIREAPFLGFGVHA